jgi:hypothetical protein
MAELSPLRRRMIEDMSVRNMSPATQQSYVKAVAKFSRYFGKSPAAARPGRGSNFSGPPGLRGHFVVRPQPGPLRVAFL